MASLRSNIETVVLRIQELYNEKHKQLSSPTTQAHFFP